MKNILKQSQTLQEELNSTFSKIKDLLAEAETQFPTKDPDVKQLLETVSEKIQSEGLLFLLEEYYQKGYYALEVGADLKEAPFSLESEDWEQTVDDVFDIRIAVMNEGYVYVHTLNIDVSEDGVVEAVHFLEI